MGFEGGAGHVITEGDTNTYLILEWRAISTTAPTILNFPNPHESSESNGQGWSSPTVLHIVPSAAILESLKMKPYAKNEMDV
jgi:hypothetical protein